MDDRRDTAERYADVFDAISDPTRLAVLLAVFRAAAREGPLSYSAAMAAAGFEDSGHFNYHLDRLQGRFLTETAEGYYPTTGAWELYSLIAHDRWADRDVDPREEPAGGACLRCGTSLVVCYDGAFRVQCPACRETLFTHPVGPDVVADADLRALARAVDATARDEVRLFVERRCPDCNGESGVYFADDMPAVDRRPEVDVLLGAGCENCMRGQPDLTVGQVLLGLPSVQDYCADHGIDLYDRPQWEYRWTRTDATTEIRSRDPWTVEKYATVDGCRLVVELEDGGTVTGTDHVRLDRVTPDHDRPDSTSPDQF